MPISISEALRAKARNEGFSAVRVTSAKSVPQASDRLKHFISQGYHGDMGWMADRVNERGNPRGMWGDAKSAVLFAMNYGQGMDALSRLDEKSSGVISVYALNRDYHDIVKGKLKNIGQWFGHATGAEVKVFVDTAPLMEKPLAQRAGLGWQGKHTNLLSRELGSWFFIGAMLTDMELPLDEPETDHCGSCRACLDICPTQAFPAPYQLDARRCISYLTIEHKGHIAREFRRPMVNRIYGCDDCLAVCPWNKFAQIANEAKLQARPELVSPELAALAQLDDASFRKLFAGSPVKRIGRDRFVRNVLIAIGNSSNPALASVVEPLVHDASPLVRAMAIWALGELLPRNDFHALRDRYAYLETDKGVLMEWNA